MSREERFAERERIVAELLKSIGEDPSREGLQRTPRRVSLSYEELTQGTEQSLEDVVGHGVFKEDCSEMIIVKDVEFYSLCEHHLLPFIGKCHIAYLPEGRVLGRSKFARIVDMYARRMQIQENLTRQIAEAVQQVTQARGVGVIIEAQHMCMMMRGVEKQNSSMKTSVMLGAFRNNLTTRQEFLTLVHG